MTNFRTLTAIQVENLTNPSRSKVRLRIKKDRPAQSGRANNLYAYIPSGEGQASRRVTGATLEPGSEEMKAAAVYFATGLHRNTIGMLGDPGEEYRSLIGPARYGADVLAKYCGILIKGALGPRQRLLADDLISPVLVPYLLGGCTSKTAESLCYQAIEVMEMGAFSEPKPSSKADFQRALSIVGFGPNVRHDEPAAAIPVNHHNHISLRQHLLLTLPRGADYAKLLIKNGAFGDSMYRMLSGYKDEVIAHAEGLLDPKGGEMTAMAATDRSNILLYDNDYWAAVRLVFEKRWDRLDLDGKQENGVQDGRVLMARNIISRVAYNDRLTAEVLVGMSLLTGISVANWTKYAVQDHIRRGETFVRSTEIERVADIAGVSPHYSQELHDQITKDATVLRELERGETRWPRKLMSPNQPLWSTTGSFYLERYNADGVPIYRHKPFTLLED